MDVPAGNRPASTYPAGGGLAACCPSSMDWLVTQFVQTLRETLNGAPLLLLRNGFNWVTNARTSGLDTFCSIFLKVSHYNLSADKEMVAINSGTCGKSLVYLQ